ncbi:MAG TPA: YciI family protein, partial [Puia sp.]
CPSHFENSKRLKALGNFILGGAILNDEGNMVGSNMILQFETEAELQDWLNTEPYITKKVWEKFEVYSFKVDDV